MDVESSMRFSLNVSVTHDGTTQPISRQEVKEEITKAIKDLFADEDDGLDLRVNVLINDYKYTDNMASLRSQAGSLLETADMETLNEIINMLREET